MLMMGEETANKPCICNSRLSAASARSSLARRLQRKYSNQPKLEVKKTNVPPSLLPKPTSLPTLLNPLIEHTSSAGSLKSRLCSHSRPSFAPFCGLCASRQGRATNTCMPVATARGQYRTTGLCMRATTLEIMHCSVIHSTFKVDPVGTHGVLGEFLYAL